ncbi:MAG TPA: hypothetical protein VL651_08560 [Bacteroidia bacterium]|jgi:hypothetical protein|nr:hypothetical protein [Bacteroidia bacterium]
MKAPWKYVLPVFVIYVALVFCGIFHHEIWLDEAHHWCLARDSSSLSELIYNARYDGHPLLWNILLYALAHFTNDPLAMQILNGMIISIAVLIFLHNAPLPFYISTAVIFGYFFLYEYSVLSRNYGLIFLFLTLICAIYPDRKKKYLLYLILLFLLSQAHLFATIIASVLLVLFLFENFKSEKKIFIISSFVFILIGVFILFTAIPPAGHFLYQYDVDKWYSFKRIGKAASVMWKGLFPFPDVTSGHPWNSNLVIALSKSVAIIPSVVAWIIPLVLLRKKRMLFFFYSSAFVIAGFIFLSPLIVGERHCGIFYLLLLAAMWMERKDASGAEQKIISHKIYSRSSVILFILILVVQFSAGIILYATDLRKPFSEAKEVSEWIRKNNLENELIIVHDHTTGPAISAYLGIPVFYLEEHRAGSFCQWNADPFIIPDESIGRAMENENFRPGQTILFVNNRKLDLSDKSDFTFDTAFTNGMVKAEEYYIYSVRK